MKIHFEEKNIKWGVTALLVVICSIAVFFAVYRFDAVQTFFGLCSAILAPFIYGLVMAYLLCPVYNFTVSRTYSLIDRRARNFKKALPLSKAIGTVVALLTMTIVVVGILWMIIPGLVDSVINIIDIVPASLDNLSEWLTVKLEKHPQTEEMIFTWINAFADNAVQYVSETLIPGYSSLATSVSEGIFGILNVLKNLFIAVIICAYFLNSKETFAAQCKKIIVAVFKEKRAKSILDGAVYTNKTFGGFINGKIIDSLIIGAICFVFMSIFGWEYSLLISCIIGITNVIPFFGPFIGAIPSTLLLLMVDPKQALYFAIFVLILQQFDGNILGPKILGDSTGLPSFWVLFAVLVGGGFFGFIGMVVGIPVFAVIYYYVSRSIDGRLEMQGFSTDISDYRIDNYRVKKSRKSDNVVWRKGDSENEHKDDKRQA